MKRTHFRHPDPKRIGSLNRVISVISVVLRETNLTIPVSTGEPVSLESEIVRVTSLSTTEISEITRLKIRSSGSEYLNSLPNGKILDLSKLVAFADNNFKFDENGRRFS